MYMEIQFKKSRPETLEPSVPGLGLELGWQLLYLKERISMSNERHYFLNFVLEYKLHA